ncbi:MAG: hypothetical protein IPL08_11355 [Saprospiraceae bacterium]|nr:hypothetical protein [Saprospiraceae bacterium]
MQLGSYGFGNLGHGANAGQIASQAGSISDILNNLNNSIICPPGTYPVYYLGIKFCKPEYYAGGGGGSNNGEQETFNNDNIGSRTTTEECIKLTKGFGITTGESGLIQPFLATNDPVTNQIRSCFNNPDIMQKIEELSQMEITDPCKNQKIDIKVDELALDLCLDAGKKGPVLLPNHLKKPIMRHWPGWIM